MLPRQDVTNTKNNLYEVNYTKMHLEEMLLYNNVQFNMSLIHFVLLISQSLKLKKYLKKKKLILNVFLGEIVEFGERIDKVYNQIHKLQFTE